MYVHLYWDNKDQRVYELDWHTRDGYVGNVEVN